jgi:hypothetical protein
MPQLSGVCSRLGVEFSFAAVCRNVHQEAGVLQGCGPNTDSGEFYEQSGTRRHHRRRDTRSTSQQRRFRTEQVLIFAIEQLGCDRLSGHPVRALGTEHSGWAAFNGPEADRSMPLWANALGDPAEMRRRFWCEEIGYASASPSGYSLAR